MDDPTIVPAQHADPTAKITRGKIEFRHVTFAYDGQHPVLKDVSFVAEPGQTVALVGQTGSGKTSTINVLMRFYEFQSGEVLIDDRDIREYPAQDATEVWGWSCKNRLCFMVILIPTSECLTIRFQMNKFKQRHGL